MSDLEKQIADLQKQIEALNKTLAEMVARMAMQQFVQIPVFYPTPQSLPQTGQPWPIWPTVTCGAIGAMSGGTVMSCSR